MNKNTLKRLSLKITAPKIKIKNLVNRKKVFNDSNTAVQYL